MKRMRITINREGKTTFKVEDAVGEDCLVFSSPFEKAVGIVEKRVLTADYEKENEEIELNTVQQERI